MKKCCCVFGVLGLILLVIAGGLFGAAYWGYGKYVQPQIGVEFFDAVGLVSGMYNFDEEKVITNPYDEVADLAAFNASFKNAFGLTDEKLVELGINPDDFDIDKILSGEGLDGFDRSKLPEDYEDKYVKPGQDINDILNNLPEGLDESDIPEGVVPSASAPFKYRAITVQGLLKLDDGAEEEAAPEGEGSGKMELPSVPDFIEVTDKQLAAVAQQYFTNYLGNADAAANLQGLQNVLQGADISTILKVAQVKLVNDGSENAKDLELALTFRANFRTLVSTLAADVEIPDFVINLLPEAFYLTVGVFPADPGRAGTVTANSFSDKQRESLKTMLGTIAKERGGYDGLMITFNATVSEMLGSLETYKIPIKFTAA